MNESFASAPFFYAAAQSEEVRLLPADRKVEAPTAFAAYPDPRSPPPPRSWVERGYNVTRWRDMERGGHFPAMELPELYVEELRGWGRELGTTVKSDAPAKSEAADRKSTRLNSSHT